MNKKNLLSGRDKELHEIAERYETAKADDRTIYLDADDIADLAEWYALHYKEERAIEVLEYGLDLHPNNTTILTEQAYQFLDVGHKVEAREIIERIDENSDEMKILKANLLWKEGREEDVDALLDNIEDKEDLANIVDISYLYADMGLPQKAWTWLARGRELYSEEEAFLAVTCNYYYSQGLIEEAIYYYNRLIDKNPYSTLYWFGLAGCYIDLKMFDKAIEACDYIITIDDEFAQAYVMKGYAFLQLENRESALENYEKAAKLDTISSDFINTFIGMNKIAEGKWEEAYNYLEKAIAAKEDSKDLSSLYANAALCLYEMGKKRKAYQYCKKARQLAPDDITSYIVEGYIYMEEEKYEKGVKRWSVALEHAPCADTWYEIGLRCVELGQLHYAKLALEHVKEMEPDFQDINERLAILYMLLKDKENYIKYNQLCKRPFRQEELEEIEKLQQTLEERDMEDLSSIMKELFDTLL